MDHDLDRWHRRAREKRANPLIYGDAQLIPYGRYTSQRPVGPTEYDVNITYPVDVSHKRKSRIEDCLCRRTSRGSFRPGRVRRHKGSEAAIRFGPLLAHIGSCDSTRLHVET